MIDFIVVLGIKGTPKQQNIYYLLFLQAANAIYITTPEEHKNETTAAIGTASVTISTSFFVSSLLVSTVEVRVSDASVTVSSFAVPSEAFVVVERSLVKNWVWVVSIGCKLVVEVLFEVVGVTLVVSIPYGAV